MALNRVVRNSLLSVFYPLLLSRGETTLITIKCDLGTLIEWLVNLYGHNQRVAIDDSKESIVTRRFCLPQHVCKKLAFVGWRAIF